ncbi:MAG TPA: VTT domain-containing protein [Candidatus Sulfotelmatobacter sp.]|nr:VTT domain-containing protein [Candidatus Sulfotelmatobacter sp.]
MRWPIAMGFALIGARSAAVWKWIHRLGGPGLILLGIADNLPFGSAPAGSVDIFVIVLSAHQPHWWAYYAVMATVGEVLGGYLTYRLAEKGGQQTFEKKIGKPRAEKLYKTFEKRGFMAVFSGAIFPPPFPFTPVLMAAGVMQYPQNKFLSALTVGRAARFFIAAYLARAYAQQMIQFFSRYYHPMMYVLIALAIAAGIGAAIYFLWYRPKAQQEQRERGEQVQEFPVPGRHARG